MNNPDNPFGSLMDKNGLINIVNIAKVAGAYIKNLKILEQWVEEEPHISWYKPQAGTTTLLYYDFDIGSREFCDRLMNEYKTLLVPGSCFDIEYSLRLGYAFESEHKKWTRLCKSVFKETGRRKDSNSLMEISEKSRGNIF